MDMLEKRPLLATCPKGLSPYLAAELRALGMESLEELPAGVRTRGSMREAMRMNLHLRTAHRVLLLLNEFRAADPDDLYTEAAAYPWETLLDPDGYVSMHARVETEAVNDSRFVNVRLKDAVVDRMRRATGRRPDSGPDKSRAVLFLHWRGEHCQLWLDTSGETLAKRGYRTMSHAAPMQETLAAGVVMGSRWKPGMHFVNPMCGSGTLGIEAALMASRSAPGLTRDNFGFMHVLGYDKAEWARMMDGARQDVRRPGGRYILTDRETAAVEAARTNARQAGVAEWLEFEVCDFPDTPTPELEDAGPGGVVVLNPEYGKRLGDEGKLEPVYAAIGDFFKQRCQGYMGYIFTGNMALAKKVGLRTKRRMIFYNSRIECRLLEYELYAGTRKG